MKMPLLLEGSKDPGVPQCSSDRHRDRESGSKDKSGSLGRNGACKSQLDGPSTNGQPTGSSCIKGLKDLQTDGPQAEHGEGACLDG